MSVSKLDVIYRKILLTKFFTKGWGSPENIKTLFKYRKIMATRENTYKLVPEDYPITIISERKYSDCRILDGKFTSPMARYIPEMVTEDIKTAYFQLVLPLKWGSDNYRPVCIHLAGTGDHFFWRRRNVMAKPLLKKGIAALILENPYYGLRKPETQIRSSLHHVIDIFVMGGCLVLECIALLNWMEKIGFGPFGITGLSMGGHMASLAAGNWPKPIVLVPCLSWTTASTVFTEGVMSESIDWDMLQDQYVNNRKYSEHLSKDCKIVDNPFFCKLNLFTETLCSKENPPQEIQDYVSPYDILHLNLSNTPNKCLEPPQKYNETSQLSTLSKEKLINLLKAARPFGSTPKGIEIKRRNKEALWFMRGMMDECTHLKNFATPFDTSLVTAVCARADAYVPRDGISGLQDLWPGCTVKFVDAGHVGAYIWHRKLFRESIVETFERAKKLTPPLTVRLQV